MNFIFEVSKLHTLFCFRVVFFFSGRCFFILLKCWHLPLCLLTTLEGLMKGNVALN